MDDINTIKKTLKKWESSFFFVHEKKPSKEDMKAAPQAIQDAYTSYASMRRSGRKGSGQEEEAAAACDGANNPDVVPVWGKELNRAYDKPVSTADGSPKSGDEGEESFSNKMGRKLLEKANLNVPAKSSVWGLKRASFACPSDKRTPVKPGRQTSVSRPRADAENSSAAQDGSKFQPPADDDSFPPLSQNRPRRPSAASRAGTSPPVSRALSPPVSSALSPPVSRALSPPMSHALSPPVSRALSPPVSRAPSHRAPSPVPGGGIFSQAGLRITSITSRARVDTPAPRGLSAPSPRPRSVLSRRIPLSSSFLGKFCGPEPAFSQDESPEGGATTPAAKAPDGSPGDAAPNTKMREARISGGSTLGFSGIFPTEPDKKRKHNVSGNPADSSPPLRVSPPFKRARLARSSHGPNFGLSPDRPDSPSNLSTHCEVGWGTESVQSCDKLMVSLDTNSQPATDDDVSPENTAKSKKASAKNIGRAKSVSSENFVRLNMKIKGYRRKGKGMTGGQHKRMMWKQKMASRSASYGDKCFKCGESGHWANKCNGKKVSGAGFGGGEKAPVKEEDFPSLRQAAQKAGGRVRAKKTAVGAAPDPASPDGSAPESGEEDDDAALWDEVEVVRTAYEAKAPPPPSESYYSLNPDGTLPEAPAEVYEALGRFGYEKFRLGQEKAVMRILCGQSTLVVLSTGAGKSLCYQLPAVMYGERGRGITLVISPLVSLMEDQVAGLPPGINGACLHTNMTKGHREKVIAAVAEGSVHFLLLSPEALVGGGAAGFLPRGTEMPPVAFACIDEAHCVSEWSHHFRPSYLRICKVLREQYGVKCMLGLTATATMVTAASVAQHLGIHDYQVATIRETPVPRNLQLSVSRDEDRDSALLGLLQGDRFSHCDSIIVYCTRREQTDRIATLIRTSLKEVRSGTIRDVPEDTDAGTKKGKKKAAKPRKPVPPPGSWSAECYHAGMSAAQRRRVQKAFMEGRLRVVVATVAFGMGIDKSDIRGVVHYALPKSYESYVQEIGRAGRDGEPAHCHLFLDAGDQTELKRHTYANSIDRVTVKKLMRKLFPPCRCRETRNRATAPKAEDFDDDGVDYSQLETSSLPEQPQSETQEDCKGSTPQASEEGVNPSRSEAQQDTSATQIQPPTRAERVCPGHERAVPIESTVQALDIKEEGIATLLCYLELHPQRWVENLTNVYSNCTVQCYGGPGQLQAVAKKCPPVGVAIAREKRCGVTFAKRNSVEFNVIEVSDVMGWESGPVKRELKLLQWDLDPTGTSGPRKSGVMVELSDLAFHLRSPGDLTDEELDAVTGFLADRVETQERTELYQLHKFYTTLHSVSHANVWLCCDEVDPRRSARLKTELEEYFEAAPRVTGGKITMLSFSRELDSAQASWLDQKDTCEHEDSVRASIRAFIHLYSEDHALTGRAIARVLHGIPSPCFPPEVWGRVRRFWRALLHVDFNVLRRFATQELIRWR